MITVTTGESSVIGNFDAASWSTDGQFLYSTDGAGFWRYEIATGKTVRYLEKEGAFLEGDFTDGISNVREQDTD